MQQCRVLTTPPEDPGLIITLSMAVHMLTIPVPGDLTLNQIHIQAENPYTKNDF